MQLNYINILLTLFWLPYLFAAECFKDRTDVQCLHRWQKVLNPELVKGPWSKEVICIFHPIAPVDFICTCWYIYSDMTLDCTNVLFICLIGSCWSKLNANRRMKSLLIWWIDMGPRSGLLSHRSYLDALVSNVEKGMPIGFLFLWGYNNKISWLKI